MIKFYFHLRVHRQVCEKIWGLENPNNLVGHISIELYSWLESQCTPDHKVTVLWSVSQLEKNLRTHLLDRLSDGWEYIFLVLSWPPPQVFYYKFLFWWFHKIFHINEMEVLKKYVQWSREEREKRMFFFSPIFLFIFIHK